MGFFLLETDDTIPLPYLLLILCGFKALDKKLRENLRDSRNSLFTMDMPSGQFRFVITVIIH